MNPGKQGGTFFQSVRVKNRNPSRKDPKRKKLSRMGMGRKKKRRRLGVGNSKYIVCGHE